MHANPLFLRLSSLAAAFAGLTLATITPTSLHAQPVTVVDATFACQQTTCDADLVLPTQVPGAPKPPVIIMAHGFGLLKDHGLAPFADRFVKAGFAVVRFDYRGFGKSGGEPRLVVDGKAHVKDWVAAIDAISKRTDVDGQRLGIWGTSYSGGHVLVAAAERPDVVKAVSSQVPFVNGISSSLNFPIKYQPQAGFYALRDLTRGSKDEPLYVPIVAKDGFAALVCDECFDGYTAIHPNGLGNDNKVAARIFMTLPFYFPGSSAADVKAPTLMVAAENDGLIPISKVRDAAKALKHGEYVELKGANHFSPYTGTLFEQVVSKQTAFFVQNLMH